MVNFKILVLILTFGILFSGCSGTFGGSSNSNIKTGPVAEDNSGTGLAVNVVFDKAKLNSKALGISFSVENSGKYPITLTKDNVKILTKQQISGNNENSIFTTNSLNRFFTNIFSGQSLTLVQNQKHDNIQGELVIENGFFKNSNNQKVDTFININYNYKTTFSNNIEINLGQKQKVIVTDPLSQAAPIGLTSFAITDYDFKDNYLAKFIFNNKVGGGEQEFEAVLTQINFKLGAQTLDNCHYFKKEGDQEKQFKEDKFTFNPNNPELIIKCLVELKNKDKYTSSISGEIKYKSLLKITKSFDLPKSRDIVVGTGFN